MAAPKTYIYPTGSSVRLGGSVRFQNGLFTTDDPSLQRSIESHPEFVAGRITLAGGPVLPSQVPGAVSTSTAMAPQLGLNNPPPPARQHTPIPPPSDALLKQNGLPVPARPVSLVGSVADHSLPELPQPSIVARWSLARILALAMGRGIQITGNPSKEDVLDLLYPPGTMAVKAEA